MNKDFGLESKYLNPKHLPPVDNCARKLHSKSQMRLLLLGTVTDKSSILQTFCVLLIGSGFNHQHLKSIKKVSLLRGWNYERLACTLLVAAIFNLIFRECKR